MLEPSDYGYAASCDFCSTEIELQTRDFMTAVEIIKRRGWKISKGEDGQWQHKCPACAEDSPRGHVQIRY